MSEHKFKIGQLVYFHPKGALRRQLDAVPGPYQITKRLPAAEDGEFQYEIRNNVSPLGANRQPASHKPVFTAVRLVSIWPRPCENSTRYNRTRNFEACGHTQSKKIQKFLFRSALQPNQISFSHGRADNDRAPNSHCDSGPASGKSNSLEVIGPIRSWYGGNDEAARVYCACGRECRMAVRCAGAASRGGPIVWVACFRAPRDNPVTRLVSTNCDAAVSLKAKTSRSNIAHMGNTSICFRNMQPS